MNSFKIYRDGDFINQIDTFTREKILDYGFIDTNRVSFVGIIDCGEYNAVFFPKQYPKILNEKHLRNHLLRLFRVLEKFNSSKKARLNNFSVESFISDQRYLDKTSIFKELIEYYRHYGLYRLRLRGDKIRLSGRINWKRTINTIHPLFNETGVPIYNRFITSSSNKVEVSEIVKIQKYLTKIADRSIGWMFGDNILYNELSSISIEAPYSNEIMIYLIKNELKKTFDSNNEQFLKNMLRLIDQDDKGNIENGIVGIKSFWVVWEGIVKVLLNDTSEKYIASFPRTGYLKNNGVKKISSNSQIPDVVIDLTDEVLIIDSKYYDVDVTLPSWYDIIKQAYYTKTLKKITDKRVSINGFIFPWHNDDTPLKETNILDIEKLEYFDLETFPSIKCFFYPIDTAFDNYLKDYSDNNFINNTLVS